MRAKQRSNGAAAKKWLYDAQRRCGGGNRCCRYALVVRSELLQRADQAIGLTHHSRASLIGGVFASAGKKELQHKGGKGRQKNHQQSRNTAAPAVIIAISSIAAEDHGPAAHGREIGNGSGDGCSDRTRQDVVVSYMRKLVSNHAFEFLIVH